MNTEILAFAFMALVVMGAYTVFGMTGFGATIIAMPLLVQFEPLAFAVPLMVLLDLVATTTVGGRSWRSVEPREILKLVPPMLAGIAAGAAALNALNPRALLLLLGVFVTLNSLWGLRSADARLGEIGSWWALPAGLVGGVFGASFGTGGPVYTLYLVRRLRDVGVFRATIAVVILISAILRVSVFGATGMLSDRQLLLTAAALLPFCLIGIGTGSILRQRIAPDDVRKIILFLLLFGGVAVIGRAMRP